MIAKTEPANKYRIWSEIGLDDIVHNYNIAKGYAQNAIVMPVVKADAYGHGAVPVARALARAGAAAFAVACPEEALELRDNGITQTILLLGDAPTDTLGDLSRMDVVITIGGMDSALRYSGAPGSGRIRAHVKIDSGMHRSGLSITDGFDIAAGELRAIRSMPKIAVEGVYTHFATSEKGPDDPFTNRQLDLFGCFCRENAGDLVCHSANSAGLLAHPRSRAGIVRPGIMLYGYNPLESAACVPLKAAMSVRTAIRQLRRVKKGDGVSYGLTWRAPHDSLIATVPAGYADGLMRCLSGRIGMLVRGQRAPQVGRICMDMCMLDVTGIPDVAAGDVATLIGRDGDEQTDAKGIADLADTIPYEILCSFSKRVPRLYL